ncbi:MAG: oligosaccharide flippase family protein, partial [Oligosphaeraceae bacterium]|nr:oligosaccharide flippase family protein [Oligosphaeraceae bacterium]
AQKCTANGLYRQDPGRYSRMISTIFSFHCLIAVLIGLITYACSFFLGSITRITDPEKLLYASKCFYVFGISAAILFPSGIFQEILVGLQKIYWRNFIIIACKLLELAGMLLIFRVWDDLFPVVVYTMALAVLSNLAMGACVLYLLPALRLRLQLDWGIMKEVAGFSGFVYLGMIGRIILNKSSRLLISIFCGLESVGIFQLSSKAAELCMQGVSQYQENISPITGALHQRGRHLMLGRIVLGALRWNSFAACALMLPAGLLIDPIMMVMFEVSDPFVNHLARLFLLSMYLSAVLRNIPHSYFIMSERHRFASWIILAEALANLLLNIVLLWFGAKMDIVIWNSLLIKLGLCVVVIIPYLLKCLQISLAGFLLQVFAQPMLSGLPVLLYILLLQHCTAWTGWTMLLVGGGGALCIYLTCMACFLPKATVHKYRWKIAKLLRLA